MSALEVTFVTGNLNKLREVHSILGVDSNGTLKDGTVRITNQNVDLPELQGSPEQVAIAKCKVAAEVIGGPVIIEDTSLCFNALGGLPGAYIRDFSEKLGNDGLYKLLSGFTDKSAYAQCIFAYTQGDDHPVMLFTGVTEGVIVSPRGSGNFGWDSVFECNGVTFAEMTPEAKNEVSHRMKALSKLREYFIN